jgi:translocation and assembly module TamB
MATVTERRTRRTASVPESPTSQKQRRPWRFRMLTSAIVLLTLVALLPAIVSRTPLAGWLVSRASADLHGKASVGSIHLGWLSAPVLADIEIRDAEDRSLLAIEHVRAERSLLYLLLNPSDLGRIRVEKPALSITYDGSGTNLEEVFGELLNSGSTESNTAAELVVTDGTVTLTDTRSSQTWQVDEFELTASLPADERSSIDLRASGRVADAEHAGRFATELALNRSVVRADPLSAIEALEAELENTPLELLAPLVARSMPDAELGGRLSAFAKCEVTGGSIQPEMAIQLTAVVDDFVLAGGGLKGDRLTIDQLEVGGRAAWRGRLIDVERLRVQTELGSAVVTGGFNLPDDSLSTLLKSLAEQTYRIEAGLNLAALAAQLPNTLRLQEGMRIQSGDATIVLESRRAGDRMHWDGHADISRLSAERLGRQISWPEPIRASLSASKSAEGLSIEHLECLAKHLKINASGTPDRVDASLDFDLAGLTEEASQLIDLGGLRLSGDGRGRFQWRRQSQQEYVADGNLQIEGFGLALGDKSGWSEEKLQLQVDAQGPIHNVAGIAVLSGKVQLDVGEDQVTATLAEPVKDLGSAPSYPVDLHTQGDLARWSTRLQPLLPLGDWQMVGRLTATGRVDYGAELTTVRNAKIHVQEFTVRSPQLNFYDPEVELLVGQAEWFPSKNRLEIPSASLAGQTVGVGVEPFAIAWSGGELSELNGTVAVRTTLDRIQQWGTATVTEPPKWMLRGNMTGRSTFQTEEGKVAFNAGTTIEQFAAYHQSGKKLEESKIRMTAKGQYDPEANALEVQTAKLESGLVGADASGTVDLGSERARIDLDGQYKYDLVRLSEMGRMHLELPLFAAGHGTSPFSYHGPISLAEAEAGLGLSWTSAEISGFLIGPGELDAQIAGGTARANPIVLDVSEGRMALTPQVTFSEEGSVLNVEPGRVAERIRISPRMCEGALQFIAPPLAGVATAEGTFSIEMEQCRIPLDAPEKGDLSGRMVIHAVSIGPGPLIRELATALGFGRTAQLSRESVVPFRMVDGRVYHRDLELIFPEVTMKTYGSVGLDQSLALIVEMPIPDKWRSGNQMLDRVVQNQMLRLPIGGSLQEPTIDRRELERQAGQFLQGAVRNVLEDQLNRQLERLLQPR